MRFIHSSLSLSLQFTLTTFTIVMNYEDTFKCILLDKKYSHEKVAKRKCLNAQNVNRLNDDR